MRRGKPKTLFPSSSSSSSALRVASKLGNVLLEASVTKALYESGTSTLPASVPISDHLVLRVLRKPSLDVSKKVDFFKWCSRCPNYHHSAAAYAYMFGDVCRAGILDDVPALLRLMKEDGATVDSATFRRLLDAFIRSGRFDSSLEILDQVEESGPNRLNPEVYNSVLVALVKKNQLNSAMAVFFKLLKSRSCEAAACNELLMGLKRAGMRAEFRSVFDKLREKQIWTLKTWGYNICIHAFGCWGDLATSLSLFQEMKERFGPDLCTYNSLIHVLCRLGKVGDALKVWEELKESAHAPDFVTYSILIHGCAKSYRMCDASKVFDEMRKSGFRPDVTVYNSFLDGLLKGRKVEDACQLFDQMTREGVRPSCWTYNILIDGLFRNGRTEAGITLFCELKRKGQLVDAITYSIVVLRLCRESQLEEAFKLVEEMEARGFVVDLVTITALLIELYRQGRWDLTEKLMKHIRNGSLVPNVLKWKANMEALLQSPQSRKKDSTAMFPLKGDFEDVMSLLNSAASEEAQSQGKESKIRGETWDDEDDLWSSSPYMDKLSRQAADSANPSSPLFSLMRGRRVQTREGTSSFDVDMINTYLSIFLAKGKLSLACKLFEILRDMGVDPVSYTYNSMLGSFVKKGYYNEVWGVLEEMGESLCPADIATYNMIIHGLGKLGRADLASTVLDRLTQQGGYLDIVMYNTLINVLGKAGRLEDARKLFEQMRGCGINPDVVTYNTLIEVNSKAGRLEDAYEFLRKMLDAGCVPSHVTHTTLDFLEKELEKKKYQDTKAKPQ